MRRPRLSAPPPWVGWVGGQGRPLTDPLRGLGTTPMFWHHVVLGVQYIPGARVYVSKRPRCLPDFPDNLI